MFIHKSTHSRFWTSLFLFLHLMALLLPVNAATVAAQAGNCADGVQTASAPAVIYAPNEEVTIPAQTVNRMLYHQLWKIPAAPELTNAHTYILDSFNMYSNLGKNDELYYQYWNEVTRRLNARSDVPRIFGKLDYDYIVNTMLDTALEIPELAPYVPRVWKKLKDYDSESIFLNEYDEVAASATRYSLNDRLVDLAEQSFIEIYDCAQKDPAIAKAVDRTYGAKLKVSVRDNAKTILAQNPDLPILKEIRDRIGEDGSISISLNQLNELSKSEFGKINATLDQMQGTIKAIDERQKVIVDYLSNQAEKEAMQALARQKAEEYQLKISAFESGISILTTITAQIDPKRAKQLSVTGNALLKVGVAINGWLKATAGQDGLDKVFSLSSVVMTGNVLGAVMNVVSLFGDSEPTPEQMILEEIGKLRAQVQELRVEMHERFDRIDQNLNAIYTTMQQRFDQIDIQLGKINGNIQEVQQSLIELDLKLSRIERNNFEFLNTLGRRPLLEAINGGLGYLERTGQPMPYQPDFVGFENTLHTWATIHAFDPLNAGPTQRDYSDGAMLAELNAYPVDANINYINGWLVAHGLPAIANKRLPSPRDWLFASRAYMQLAMEWPDHMQRIDPKRGEALKQIGLELEAAMRNLSTLGTLTDTVGNQLLISSVITNYQGEIDTLDASIESVENAYMNEVRTARLARNEPFLVHGGAYQTLAYRAAGIRHADCPDATKTCELPGELADRIPGFNIYNLADYLKLGTFSAQLVDAWSNEARECGAAECYQIGDHQVLLIVYFNDVRVLQQKIQLLRKPIPADRIWIRDNYTANIKDRFARLTEIIQPSPEQEAVIQKTYSETLKKVETQLAAYEKELYGRILNEFNQGSLKSVAAEVEGSKALLDAVVTLGLPRASSNDEFLHAMLYGNQQLLDQRPLIQSYVERLAKPIEGSNLTYNPRFMLETVADQRSEVFQTIVNQYLDGISSESYAEEADYLANTRRALELTMQIVAMESGAPQPTPTPIPPAGDAKRVYLPVVQR